MGKQLGTKSDLDVQFVAAGDWNEDPEDVKKKFNMRDAHHKYHLSTSGHKTGYDHTGLHYTRIEGDYFAHTGKITMRGTHTKSVESLVKPHSDHRPVVSTMDWTDALE